MLFSVVHFNNSSHFKERYSLVGVRSLRLLQKFKLEWLRFHSCRWRDKTSFFPRVISLTILPAWNRGHCPQWTFAWLGVGIISNPQCLFQWWVLLMFYDVHYWWCNPLQVLYGNKHQKKSCLLAFAFNKSSNAMNKNSGKNSKFFMNVEIFRGQH